MNLRHAGRSGKSRRGAVALEMAIIVPFVAFMFAVIVDYCRIYYVAQVVHNAARTGALYASSTVTGASGLTPQQAAQQGALAEAASLSPTLQATDVTVTMSASTAKVAVNYQFRTLTRILGLPPQIAVNATVIMPLST